MKPGDLVRVTYRGLIYTTRRGGHCIGAAGLGETALVLDYNTTDRSVKILHPTHGPGFITRAYVEVISEAQ